ncbi:spore germination protein [filamentous cyanobacterium CCP5]|nr:spore germination protein [filamentous cyanobacterium CCP5]
MENNRGFRSIPLSILVAIGIVVLASGGSAAWFTWRTLNPKPPVAEFPTLEGQLDDLAKSPVDAIPSEPVVPDTPTKQPESSPTAQDVTLELYWLKDTGTAFSLTPEAITLPAEGGSETQLKSAFEQLLAKAGNPDQDAFSTIPDQTRLLGLSVEPDGVHVNLSEEFRQGGGSASMTGRLGQVIYTASALNADVPVWISIEGKPLDILGGEGLLVDQPMTRADFAADFDL